MSNHILKSGALEENWWWKKSCTSWLVVNCRMYRALYIPGGCLGCLPSIVNVFVASGNRHCLQEQSLHRAVDLWWLWAVGWVSIRADSRCLDRTAKTDLGLSWDRHGGCANGLSVNFRLIWLGLPVDLTYIRRTPSHHHSHRPRIDMIFAKTFGTTLTPNQNNQTNQTS